jgi:acyl-CoA thioesterase YciA
MTDIVQPETPLQAPDQQPVVRVIAMPADTNPEGDIFGGWLLAQMDLAGSTPAFDLAHGRCATIAVDGMVFHQPVSVGDEVSIYANCRADLDPRPRRGLAPPRASHEVSR